MMKSLHRIFLLGQLILLPQLISGVFADPPGPPGPGGDPGGGGGVPVGAPIDNAIIVLIALGMVYGGYKLYIFRKKNLELKEEESPRAS